MTERKMGFIKAATVAIASGIGVGAVFFTLGGVANTVFPSITPTVLGVVGFSAAVAIALITEQ